MCTKKLSRPKKSRQHSAFIGQVEWMNITKSGDDSSDLITSHSKLKQK
jgi:hypothetical protein